MTSLPRHRPSAAALALLAAGTAAAGTAAPPLSRPALALQEPVPAPRDPRVRTVVYDEMNVVRLSGTVLASTQVVFSPDEEITQVAVGDAQAWIVAPTGNLLFVKPAEERAPTNMQVVTRRPDGSRRSYQFELRARSGGVERGEAGAVFKVQFRYPTDERAAAAARAAEARGASAARAASDRLDVDHFYGPRNWRYSARGSAAVEPLEVSDNGRLTAFRFPGNAEVPVIYAVAPDGSEAIAPRTVRGELVLVHATAAQFRLRRGAEVLCVFNHAFDPVGRNPGTGTVTPEVSRGVRRPRGEAVP